MHHLLVQPQSVWTGSELVVVGNLCIPNNEPASEIECEPGIAAGAYDLDDDSWRVISLPPELDRGTEAYVESLGWTGNAAAFHIFTDTWSYSPDEDEWQVSEPPPFEPEVVCVSESGVAAVTFTDSSTARDTITEEDGDIPLDILTDRQDSLAASVDAAVLESVDGSWEEFADPAVDSEQAPSYATAYCGGPNVFVLPPDPIEVVTAKRFETGNRSWEDIESPPSALGVNSQHLWTGQELLVWGGPDVLSYDVEEDTWKRSSPVPPADSAVWAGDRAVLYYLGDGTPSSVRYEIYQP